MIGLGSDKNSERPVDALAVKKVNHSLTENLKSRDASASKNLHWKVKVAKIGSNRNGEPTWKNQHHRKGSQQQGQLGG